MSPRPRVAALLVLLVGSACGDDAAADGAGGQGAASGTPSSNDAASATSTASISSSEASSGSAGGPVSGPGGGDGGNGPSGSGGAAGSGGAPAVWSPAPGATWQWQLDELPLDTSFDVAMYDIDLFDSDADTIAALQDEGRIVVCYFNAGTWEPWRPDADDFPDEVKGEPFDDPKFSEELYLDIRAEVVEDIMRARLDLAAEKGCDAVEPESSTCTRRARRSPDFPSGTPTSSPTTA